jgi:hypothetical protein
MADATNHDEIIDQFVDLTSASKGDVRWSFPPSADAFVYFTNRVFHRPSNTFRQTSGIYKAQSPNFIPRKRRESVQLRRAGRTIHKKLKHTPVLAPWMADQHQQLFPQ